MLAAIGLANLWGSESFPVLYLAKFKTEAAYVHPEILTAAEAKKNGLWWLNNDTGRGIALGPVNIGPVFSQLYPGYPDAMRADTELWTRYFQYPFEPTVPWLENDGLGALGLNITIPWLGCFDIYRRFGADIVIFGSSEVYKAIIPAGLLQRSVDSSAGAARVLQCGVGSMSVEAVRNAIQKLKELRPGKVVAVIWGYSFWTAFERGMKQVQDGDRIESLASYSNGKALAEESTESTEPTESTESTESTAPIKTMMHVKGSDLFPALNWNSVLPISFSILANEEVNLRDGVLVPRVLNGKNVELKRFVESHFKPFYTVFNGVKDEDCDLKQAEENLGETVRALQGFADETFIYLTPTTPIHHASAPSCFRPNVKAILVRSERPDVHISIEEMVGYDLTWSDFLRPAFDKSLLYFDPNHVNHVGARKVTDKIGQWMSERLAKR